MPSSASSARDDRRSGLDRRRFLGLMGAGGVGVAGLSLALPGLAWAETIDAITLGERLNQLAVASHGSSWQWAEKCQAAQSWAETAVGGLQRDYPTANDARAASGTLNTNPASAPAGSFSWFNASSSGHVVTNIGNGYCINTSPQADGTHYHTFERGLYISKVADYKGGPYLGWTTHNGINPQIPVQAWSPGGDDTPTSTWAWNAPDTATQKRVQVALAKRNRYSGLQDGQWGINSIKGIQTTCQNVGYKGPVDGKPGPNTCHYVQLYAQTYGSYKGGVDNVLGPNSWSGFALGLERP